MVLYRTHMHELLTDKSSKGVINTDGNIASVAIPS